MRRRKRSRDAELPERKLSTGVRRQENEKQAEREIAAGLRRDLEVVLGEDLQYVRIHDDPAAHRKAYELGAAAYAEGRDLYFAAGRFQPDTAEGRNLLAHEYAHAAQSRKPGESASNDIEAEANEVADALANKDYRPVSHAAGSGPRLTEEDAAAAKPKLSVHPTTIKAAQGRGVISLGSDSVHFEFLVDDSAEEVSLLLHVGAGISVAVVKIGSETSVADAGGDKARTVRITAPSGEPSAAKVTFSAGAIVHVVHFEL